MPSAMTSAVDLSAVALAKLHSRIRLVTSGNEAAVNEPDFHRSARGIAPRATWAAAPK
jgi:aspartate ammonia-lyase